MAPRHPFRFGVVAAQAPSADAWIATARRAEELGFSTFSIPDTLGPTLAPMPALAAVAVSTRTLRIGPYVLANDLRNPVLLAREAATLDFLSAGRLELGLGAGRPGIEADYRKLGIPLESGGVRVERLAEAVGIVKALLSASKSTSRGSTTARRAQTSTRNPVQQPHPPILIAGAGACWRSPRARRTSWRSASPRTRVRRCSRRRSTSLRETAALGSPRSS